MISQIVFCFLYVVVGLPFEFLVVSLSFAAVGVSEVSCFANMVLDLYFCLVSTSVFFISIV